MPSLGNRGLEPRGMRDCVLGHEPAIAPPADAEAIRISDPLFDQIVDTVHQILESHSAPIGNRLVHSPTFTSDAASVWKENDVAIRSQQLSPVPPFTTVPSHPPGRVARMRVDDRRVTLTWLVVRRCDEHTATHQTIFRILPLNFAQFPDSPCGCLRIEVG